MTSLRNQLMEVHSALDSALGDTDVSHIESDDELRDEEPVQWAAAKLMGVIDAIGAAHIWEARVSDGVRQYFEGEVEAKFFRDDTVQAGFTVHLQKVPLPTSPKEFVAFMEREFASVRPLILAAAKMRGDR